MNEPSPKPQWQNQIRQPKVIIGLGISVLLILNILFYLQSTSSSFRENRDVIEELKVLKQEYETLEGKPDPDAVSKQDILELLQQVPTNQEEAKVIEKLFLFNRFTGTFISFFEEGKEINETEGNNAGIFTSSKYRITVVGAFPNLLKYFALISSNTALTSVEKWEFAEMEEVEAETIPELTQKQGKYKLTLFFTMYSIPSYRELFGPSPNEGTSAEEMLHKLKQKYPDFNWELD